MIGGGQFRLHGLTIAGAIDLRPGATHSGSLGAVEQSKLNGALVGQSAHDAIQRVDFPNQMTLAQAPDRGITGHDTDRRRILGQKRRPHAHARGCGSRLAACMTPANDDDIKTLHHSPRLNRLRIESVSRETLFPDTEAAENLAQHILRTHKPDNAPERPSRQAQLLRCNLERLPWPQPIKRCAGVPKPHPMALP